MTSILTCALCHEPILGRHYRAGKGRPWPNTPAFHRACRKAVLAAHAETPWTRVDCAGLPKPCPRTRCRYHFQGDRARPGLTWSTAPTAPGCSLDWLDEHPGEHTLGEIGRVMGVTRERIRQIEARALKHLQRRCRKMGINWEEFAEAFGILERRVA